jgi:methyl-accepting chemotaxis protein
MKEIIAAVRSLKGITPAALATSRRQLEDSDQVARTVTELDAMTRNNSLFVQKFAQASEAVCELVGDLEAAAGRSQIDRSGSSSAVAARKWKRTT